MARVRRHSVRALAVEGMAPSTAPCRWATACTTRRKFRNALAPPRTQMAFFAPSSHRTECYIRWLTTSLGSLPMIRAGIAHVPTLRYCFQLNYPPGFTYKQTRPKKRALNTYRRNTIRWMMDYLAMRDKQVPTRPAQGLHECRDLATFRDTATVPRCMRPSAPAEKHMK